MTAYRNFRLGETSQSKPIPDSNQVANSAGGFTWEVSHWEKLQRFLILGTEGGTYYIKEKELTTQNATSVIKCIKEDGMRVLETIKTISTSGRAARNDPALFALALCFAEGDETTRKFAKHVLPEVARTGTHLFHFAQYVQNMRGWGRTLKKAVANWYDNSQRDLAYQLVKYRQRDGWTHADLLRLSHPTAHPDLYNWVLKDKPAHAGREINTSKYRIIEGFEKIQMATSANEAAGLILEYRLPREAVPTQYLDNIMVWDALLQVDMGYEAMIRNLGNMGKVGLLAPMSGATKRVVERLADGEALRKARLHPIKLLSALRTYNQGHGYLGSNTWRVVPQISDALNDAFYESFGAVTPTGKNTMLALDVSGSMGSPIMNLPGINCREASAVLAMVTARVEPNHMIVGFSAGNSPTRWGNSYGTALKELNISPHQRLVDVVASISNLPFGGTDCALPMVYATDNHFDIDTFAVYTDSETWAGNIHPSEALLKYRQQSGRKAKLAVVGMVANDFSIADPNDPGMMDFVGFDTNTPDAISTFVREE